MLSRTSRAFVALSALWLAMLMVAGPMLHECAMHAGGAEAALAETAASHAGHGGAEQAPDDEGCDHCTCLGDCTSAAPPEAGSATYRVPPPVASLQAAVPYGSLALDSGAPDVRLPYPLGPPLFA